MISPRMRSAATTASLLMLTSALLIPKTAQAQQTSATALTKSQSAAAKAGAKAALLRLAKSQTLPEAAAYLTDRSAGTLGFVFAIPMTVVIGFTPTGTPDKPSPDPSLQPDFQHFITRYLGDPESNDTLTKLPDTFQGHERAFVQDLVGFNTRLKKISKDADVLKFNQPLFTGFSQYKFTALSPTEVKIVPAKASAIKLPGVTALRAIQENRQWRIDFGDPNVILKAVQAASNSPAEPKSDPMADKMTTAIKTRDIAQIKNLLHAEPKLIETRDSMGETPLYTAVFYDDVPTTNFLIAHGAKVNARDEFGETVLNEAVFFERKDIVALLKKHGGKMGVKTKNAF